MEHLLWFLAGAVALAGSIVLALLARHEQQRRVNTRWQQPTYFDPAFGLPEVNARPLRPECRRAIDEFVGEGREL